MFYQEHGQFTVSVLCVNPESLQSSEVLFTKDAIDEWNDISRGVTIIVSDEQNVF